MEEARERPLISTALKYCPRLKGAGGGPGP